MLLFCDAHIHIYPHFNVLRALDSLMSAADTFRTRENELLVAGILCERKDCRVFEDWAQGGEITPVTTLERATERVLHLKHRGRELAVAAGRQLNSAERLEFLAYGLASHIPDGLPWATLVDDVRKAGGLPVLNWAAGKWMFSRKAIVKEVLRNCPPSALALCDTSLRATFWPMPRIMRAAPQQGRAVFAGSDPLPLTGEEQRLGMYGVLSEVPADVDLWQFIKDLHSGVQKLQPVGRRSSVGEFFFRQGKHYVGASPA